MLSARAFSTTLSTYKGNLTFLAGRLRMPNGFPAGNYEMEVTAYDRLESPKKQAAMQWTDLTIVRPESPE